MESMAGKLLEAALSGGASGVIAILVAVIAGMAWFIKKLLSDIEKKDTKIEKIIDDYYKGNITITEALNGLKMVLVEIKAKL